MKIKSLLLGSAAALVAVSGAKAADAIVVEAEPMEYVKVCDMYGAGYFYIPGTETCLKFGGELRVQYAVATDHEDGEISDHNANVRLRFTIDAKNETEYGTLHSAARVDWTRSAFNIADDDREGGIHDTYSAAEASTAGASLGYGYIALAGFKAGYGGTGIHGKSWDSWLDADAIYLNYTYSADPLAVTVGIMDHTRSGAAGQPDPYVRADYSGEGFTVGGFAVLDTSTDGVAYGVDATMDLSSFIPGGKFTAFWQGDDYDYDANAACALGATATAALCGGTDYVKGHVWGVRLDYQVLEGLTGFTRYSETDGWLSYDAMTDAITAGTQRKWRSGLTWAIASGLKLEGHYTKTIESGSGNWEFNLLRSF